MKKIFILFFAFVITGCKKNPASPVPIPISAPKFTSVSLSADSIWYQSATTIKWTTSDATKVDIINGSNTVLSGGASSGSFPTPILTGNITYTLTATGAGGTASKTVDIHVLTPTMTLLGWDNVRQQNAKWQMTDNVSTLTNVISWVSGPISCNQYIFYPNNTNTTIVGCGTNPAIGTTFVDVGGYQLLNNEKELNWGHTDNPPNTFIIKTLTETTLQLSQTKIALDGREHTYLWTFQKVG